MAPALRLLTLDLRSPLVYPRALPPDASPSGFFPPGPAAEGEEELYVFPEDGIREGPEGPTLSRPLGAPSTAWSRKSADETAGSAGAYLLEAGSWLFMQWRPASAEELAAGLEWFAREAWWERRKARGPWCLRVLVEDGRRAWQALRRLQGPD